MQIFKWHLNITSFNNRTYFHHLNTQPVWYLDCDCQIVWCMLILGACLLFKKNSNTETLAQKKYNWAHRGIMYKMIFKKNYQVSSWRSATQCSSPEKSWTAMVRGYWAYMYRCIIPIITSCKQNKTSLRPVSRTVQGRTDWQWDRWMDGWMDET